MASIFPRIVKYWFFGGAALLPIVAVSAPEAGPILQIAEVCKDADGDHLPDLLGQTVTARGVVTVGAGTFHTKRLQGFMQDATGGIQIFANRSETDIHEGDLIEVRGRLGNHKGQTQLHVAQYGLLKQDVALPEPIHLSLKARDTDALEKQEGMLATVRGRVTGKRRNQGGEFLLLEQDGMTGAEEENGIIIFVHNTRATGIPLERYSVGDELEVRGILSQYDYGAPYDEDYEVLPRHHTDIRPIGLTRRFYRRALAIGVPASFMVLAWLVGLRLQVGVHTRRRLEAERRLKDEQERQAVTLRSIGEGVIAADTEGAVTVLNHRAETLTGWSGEAALGRPLAEVFPVKGAASSRESTDILHDVLASNAVLTLPPDTRLVSHEGEELLITCTASPVHASHGERLGVVFVFDDCSERTRVEAELQKASRLESIGLLAGGIAHDFNNILTTISGNLSLARLDMSDSAGEEFGQVLEEAEKAAIDARALTNQLLTFSRGGAPIKQPLLLGDLVREAASFALRGANVKSEVAVDEGLWAVDADAGQMRQVVQNIVLNGQEAMPEGGYISLTVSNIEFEAGETPRTLPISEGRYVRTTVQDRGSGISPEHQEKIFDPYFTTKKRGSGLGLATSYSIVRNHGGIIAVSSKLGEGTTFDVYLPATDAPVDEGGEGARDLKPGSGRVLVMDDEKRIRTLVAAMLRKAGYDASCAEDGQAAIDACVAAKHDGRPFDVAVLDLTVPNGMGGQDAVKRLREIDPNMKVIVSSGYSSSPVMANFRSHGFDGAVPKPYTTEVLIHAVQTVYAPPSE